MPTKRRSSPKRRLSPKRGIPAVGSRASVFHSNAVHTSGGLTKSDLVKNKRGEIVSKKKQAAGRKLYKKFKSILKEYQY